MRFVTIALLALATSLIEAVPASAYVLMENRFAGAGQITRWPEATLPLRFQLSDRPVAQLLNLAPNSKPQAAVEAAIRSWSAVGMQIELEGTSSKTDTVFDGLNLISLADTPANRNTGLTDFLGQTLIWFRTDTGLFREADILMNPRVRWATDGRANVDDVEATLVHEIGHAFGLDHSPLASSTMFFSGSPGDIIPRRITWDDVAGARALYLTNDASSTAYGALVGRVVDESDTAILGAHVVAVDASGIAQVGALTDANGEFSLTSLPPGSYRVFAEPLDGPTTPDVVGLPSLRDPANPVPTKFRTRFLEENGAPASIAVAAGETRRLDPIAVPMQAPNVNPVFIAWRTVADKVFSHPSAAIRPGEFVVMLAAGPGMDRVPDDGFRASGTDIVVDTSQVVRDELSDGTPLAAYVLGVRAGSRPGPRNLYFVTDDEIAVYPGAIRVTGP
jgi:hypothetical protein